MTLLAKRLTIQPQDMQLVQRLRMSQWKLLLTYAPRHPLSTVCIIKSYPAQTLGDIYAHCCTYCNTICAHIIAIICASLRILQYNMCIGAHIIAIICASLRILQYNMRIGAHIIAIICALLRILQYNMCISVYIIVILALMIFFQGFILDIYSVDI